MSELTDYAAYSPSKSAKQTKLQTLEAGLFPFLPFSTQYSLKLQEKILLAPDLQKRDVFQTYMDNYDFEEEGETNQLNPTLAQTRGLGIKRKGTEYGDLLSQLVVENARGKEDNVARKTKVRQDYTGEIASEIVASDVIDQLKERDEMFSSDWDSIKDEIDMSMFTMSNQYLDKNQQTPQSREIIQFYLNVLKQNGKINTDRVLGIEETAGLMKRTTNIVGLLGKDTNIATVKKKFAAAVAQEESELNAVIESLGPTIDNLAKTRDKIPPKDSDGKLIESNVMARQVLSRFGEMLLYNSEGLKGDRYLYTVPLGAPKGTAYDEINQRAHFLGLYYIMPSTTNGVLSISMEMADVLDLGQGAFATLDNYVLTQIGTQGTILENVNRSQIDNIGQAISDERALDKFNADSIGMSSARAISTMLEGSLDGNISIAQVLSTKQINMAILKSFERYSEGKQQEVAELIKRMVIDSNKLSQTWKKSTASALSYETRGGLTRYDWKRNSATTEDGVWQDGMKGPWTEGQGTGLSISPYLVSTELLTQDYPNMFANRAKNFRGVFRSQRQKYSFRK